MEGSRKALVEAVVTILLVGGWLLLTLHYWEVVSTYADMNWHVSHPAIYIAAETWLLISLIIPTFLTVKFAQRTLDRV